MQKDIIHLKYPLDDKHNEILRKLSPLGQESYQHQADNSTICWTNTYGIDITVTDDATKVTCRKCKQQLKIRLSNSR